MLRWNHEQRNKLLGLYQPQLAALVGCTRNDFDQEVSRIQELYLKAFHSNVDPGRKLWREWSFQGTALKGGFLSHEWRTLVWKSLEAYQGKCFKIAMVATYDKTDQTFVRHWISVTFGPRPKAFGASTVVLDPWFHLKPEIDSDGTHEKGDWLGTRFDDSIGPGGTFIDDQGNPTGAEVGPIQ